ncbi:MAG: mechanosensitive ion channel [Nitrospirales bacterium]|nr:mechanosensitive ion channel [Nitrospira sp.]MDR4502204.1 mechanosensitive ion channel [Nitrospirales bacterium]
MPELSWDMVQRLLSFPLFTVNQTPITISSLFIFCAVIGLGVVVSKLVRAFLERRVLSRMELSAGTHYTLIRIAQYLLWVLAGVIAFQFIGIDLSSIAVLFGFLSVGIGFGLQNLTSNFIAGLMLLFERPIVVGDRVTVGGIEGDVIEINIRSTTIRSLNHMSIIVPNSEFISGTVTNWSHGDPRTRVEIDVGVSYSSDLRVVLQALLEAGTEHPHVLQDPKPKAWLMSFGDSAWNMRLLVWLDSPKDRAQVISDVNCAIVEKFREYHVEIPFPQRDIHVRDLPASLPAVFQA